ncbi:MAG: hypothetical protein AAFR11_11670 [Pseudomonadota bacterium]
MALAAFAGVRIVRRVGRATGFTLLAAMPDDVRAARLDEARSTRGFVAYAAMQSAPHPTAGVISVGY